MGTFGFTITRVDPRYYSEDDLAVGVAFNNAVLAESFPDDPPIPFEVARAAHATVPERFQRASFRAWDASGALVGRVSVAIDPEHDDDPDLLFCQINVAPFARRRGVGSALLAEVSAYARTRGRSRLLGQTSTRVPAGAAFAEHVGAVAKTAGHVNQLLIADVDRRLMESWVRDGPVRSAGYELVAWDGPIPEEHLGAYLDLIEVMNDQPHDDLEVNDVRLTAEQIREREAQSVARAVEHWTLVARRTSDGELAGFHDVVWAPHEPATVYVWSTGVRAEHRGHALGKWLKATMTLRVMAERPGVCQIRTGNADSNDAMLGINRQMGYKPFIAKTTWELAVEPGE